jgi:hypothetical protein
MVADIAVRLETVTQTLQRFHVSDLAGDELGPEARHKTQEPREPGRRRRHADHVAKEDLQRSAGAAPVESPASGQRGGRIGKWQLGCVEGRFEDGERVEAFGGGERGLERDDAAGGMAEDIARTPHRTGDGHDIGRLVRDVDRPPPRGIRAIPTARDAEHPVRAGQSRREPGVPPAVVQAAARR